MGIEREVVVTCVWVWKMLCNKRVWNVRGRRGRRDCVGESGDADDDDDDFGGDDD